MYLEAKLKKKKIISLTKEELMLFGRTKPDCNMEYIMNSDSIT